MTTVQKGQLPYSAIDAAKCLAKRKSGDDLLLVMLKKTKEGEQWDSLLKLEKKQKEKSVFIASQLDD